MTANFISVHLEVIHREGALREESVESLKEEGAVFAIESQ